MMHWAFKFDFQRVFFPNFRGEVFGSLRRGIVDSLGVLLLHLDPEGPCFQTIDDAKLPFIRPFFGHLKFFSKMSLNYFATLL